MAAMRKGQIELEIAAEPLDAEPAPRALSRIVWDAKTKLYTLFGGEHMDYSTNDLWVFDPASAAGSSATRAPPRGPLRRALDASGDGKLVMRGGCAHEPGKNYFHIGPAKWIYDLEKNTWTADGHQEKTWPSDTRSAKYYPPAGPEHFMKGARPDAAANEAKLKALPVNTWVKMKTAVPLGGRDWATWVYDTDRDMLYVWAGGHSSYPGNDVARYHLATDRWEISDPSSCRWAAAAPTSSIPRGSTSISGPGARSTSGTARPTTRASRR